ncbi:MAG TPA: ABC transporter permease subunit [Casimicrobiaceae bacterium]|nr:ABC transporter permease subunit [Casimicrobiaceae bacterium]
MRYIELMGFGPTGWGLLLLRATGMTVAVSTVAFLLGSVLGALLAWARIEGNRGLQLAAEAYTIVLRGIPDLLVIYLLYFGGSAAMTAIGHALGAEGFVGINAFASGAIAKGELEAGRAVGMSRRLLLRRIIVPQTLRFAIPGLGNVWQLALKESALISVVGLTEILRQAQVGAGSTRQPFAFFITAAILYMLLTSVSGWGFRKAEIAAMRGVRRA